MVPTLDISYIIMEDCLCTNNSWYTLLLQRNCLYFALTTKPVFRYVPKFRWQGKLLDFTTHSVFSVIIFASLVCNSIVLCLQVRPNHVRKLASYAHMNVRTCTIPHVNDVCRTCTCKTRAHCAIFCAAVIYNVWILRTWTDIYFDVTVKNDALSCCTHCCSVQGFQSARVTIYWINFFFTVLFSVEAVLKIIAQHPVVRAYEYVCTCMCALHVDFWLFQGTSCSACAHQSCLCYILASFPSSPLHVHAKKREGGKGWKTFVPSSLTFFTRGEPGNKATIYNMY